MRHYNLFKKNYQFLKRVHGQVIPLLYVWSFSTIVYLKKKINKKFSWVQNFNTTYALKNENTKASGLPYASNESVLFDGKFKLLLNIQNSSHWDQKLSTNIRVRWLSSYVIEIGSEIFFFTISISYKFNVGAIQCFNLFK